MASKRIFISYSKKDTEYVSSLVQALRQQGFDVWFDKNIMTGNDWDDTIEEEIKKADTLILILSKTSVASENVKDEMSYALSLGKSVNPIKIENCDVPMRLARKQYIDFEVLGPEVGFQRLVRDINMQLTNGENVQEAKVNFVPPRQYTTPNRHVPKPKSNNNLLYIIGGIGVGITLVIAFIFILVAIFNPSTDDTYTETVDPYQFSEETVRNSVEDEDWNNTYSKNNLDSYIAFLYHYGKSTKYYANAYTELNTILNKSATVWYGIKGGEYNFKRYLYYYGDQTMPPQIDDIITPIFKSELYEGDNFERYGNYIQPGKKLLVYDVWVDENNNIWARVRYQ